MIMKKKRKKRKKKKKLHSKAQWKRFSLCWTQNLTHLSVMINSIPHFFGGALGRQSTVQ